ncbi:hypothetical protein Hypma_012110 [Hypsizygus marmoreus]|uniref:Uncharacterized protein n=1 Tax=Hypsizygus marmoreus TaxID=39966 RepID=A0A369JMN4_HYPMA|nr:hypothetical protein Hypma_012110 [Hypsizygus marmoreus]
MASFSLFFYQRRSVPAWSRPSSYPLFALHLDSCSLFQDLPIGCREGLGLCTSNNLDDDAQIASPVRIGDSGRRPISLSFRVILRPSQRRRVEVGDT